MNRQISEAVSLLRDSPVLDDDELFEMLVLRGIERRLAARLVEFLPMVYCRILMQDSGASFPNVYHRPEADGTVRSHELSGDPVWNGIVEFARKEVETGKTVADIRSIAQRGAEYRTATQLVESGSALENIAFTPMMFKWPEDGPTHVPVKQPRNPKWWPFRS